MHLLEDKKAMPKYILAIFAEVIMGLEVRISLLYTVKCLVDSAESEKLDQLSEGEH